MDLPAKGMEADESGAVSAALSEEDWTSLRRAVDALERGGLAHALGAAVGRQIRGLADLAPRGVAKAVSSAVDLALKAALKAALASLRGSPSQERPPATMGHRAAVALSGAAGGAFGLATLPLELPLSTAIMLRSIAEIARSEGEDLSDPEAALSCIEVFALAGGPDGDAWENGYFAVRAALAKAMGSAAAYLAGRSLVEESAPALVRYLSVVGTRFGAAVTQKLAAQAVPLIGAAGGAAVNYVFLEHFQRLAKAHFTVRRLERRYGPAVVRAAYEQIRLARAGDRARPAGSGAPGSGPSEARHVSGASAEG